MSNTEQPYKVSKKARRINEAALKKSLAAIHPHSADLVVRFATALADKLGRSEQKYGWSDDWANNDWEDRCKEDIVRHMGKGDPRDVANYCAFMWHHGWETPSVNRSFTVFPHTPVPDYSHTPFGQWMERFCKNARDQDDLD